MGRYLSSAVVIIAALATALTAAAEVEVVIEDFSSPGRGGLPTRIALQSFLTRLRTIPNFQCTHGQQW